VLVAAVLAVVLLNRGDDEDGGKEPAKAAKKTGKRAPATGPLPAREAQVDKVALGPNADPGTMVADGNGVWVLDRRAGDLVRVDKVSGYVFGRVPVGKGVTDFAIQPCSVWLWIANARERTLTEITLRRGAPVGPPIKLPIGPTDITLEGSDKWIYALAAGDSESWMVRVDKKRRRVAGDPFRIDGARDLAEGSSVVAAGGDSKLLLFTLTYKLEFPKAYTLGTGKAGKVEKSPGKVWLPVQGNGGGSVLRLDEFSGKRVGRPIRVGARPNGITYSLDDGNVWVASQDGTLARIQEKSGRIVGKPISLGENEIRGDVAVAGDVVWVTANDHLIRVKP
jgi:DNA-binding beta-propeller fold protein YncE